jgi:hypothetical protein
LVVFAGTNFHKIQFLHFLEHARVRIQNRRSYPGERSRITNLN